LLKIGLTGGIGCGKSVAAQMMALKSALLIDADRLAREVVEPGKPAWEEIVKWLGRDILMEDGTLDRRRLGEIVFGDEKKLQKLNAIVHPHISALFSEKSSGFALSHPERIQVWEVPLLFEVGMQKKVDYVVVIAASRENQVQRLMARDYLSKEEILKRINSQLPLREKISAADFVIYNDGTEEQLQEQVDLLWQKIKELPC
jgi:dephospho-CoA kinase